MCSVHVHVSRHAHVLHVHVPLCMCMFENLTERYSEKNTTTIDGEENAKIKRKNATGVCRDNGSGIPARDPENSPGRWRAAMSRQKEGSSSSEPCNKACDDGALNRGLLQLPIPVRHRQRLGVEDPGFDRG